MRIYINLSALEKPITTICDGNLSPRNTWTSWSAALSILASGRLLKIVMVAKTARGWSFFHFGYFGLVTYQLLTLLNVDRRSTFFDKYSMWRSTWNWVPLVSHICQENSTFPVAGIVEFNLFYSTLTLDHYLLFGEDMHSCNSNC